MARQRLEPGQSQRLLPIDQAIALCQRRELRFLRAVGQGFGKARDMDRSQLRQRAEDVVRADLVAAVGRERHAVREEEDFPAHPSPLAIAGPRRLASASGKRRHKAIRAACFALVGSASRGSAPGAVQLA